MSFSFHWKDKQLSTFIQDSDYVNNSSYIRWYLFSDTMLSFTKLDQTFLEENSSQQDIKKLVLCKFKRENHWQVYSCIRFSNHYHINNLGWWWESIILNKVFSSHNSSLHLMSLTIIIIISTIVRSSYVLRPNGEYVW